MLKDRMQCIVSVSSVKILALGIGHYPFAKDANMENGKKLLRWIAPAAIAVIVLGGIASLSSTPVKAITTRPDVVSIDVIGQFKRLDMPPAVFLHDEHAQALGEKGRDCTVCHVETAEGKRSFKGWAESGSPKKMEDKFHEGCIGCHADMDRGPHDGECRTCHDARTAAVSAPEAVVFGKSLHFLHVDSQDIKAPYGDKGNCGVCHHVYDEKLEKTLWIPGKEEACSTCHADKAEGNKPALKDAMHTNCVWCHADVAAAARTENPEAAAQPNFEETFANGPQNCSGCHTLEAQAKFRNIEDTPRLMRGQPDKAILLGEKGQKMWAPENGGMKAVLFDHKAHEAQTETCKTCHTGGIEAASTAGLASMFANPHSPVDDASCVGCHTSIVNQVQDCAGCHGGMQPLQKDSCSVCHVDVAGLGELLQSTPANMDLKAQLGELASAAVKPAPAKPLDPQEIPEVVEIGTLSNEYAPSQFPHRQIYAALLKGVEDNGLAAAFHGTPTTMCGACHHNVPQADVATPPKCSSCHMDKGNQTADAFGMPTLRAAYHQQCMACHNRMQVAKPANTDCAGCHTPIQK